MRGSTSRPSLPSRSTSDLKDSETTEDEVLHSFISTDGDPSTCTAVNTDLGGLNILDRLHRLCETASAPSPDHGSPGNSPHPAFSSAFDLAPPECKLPISWDVIAFLPSKDSIVRAVTNVLGVVCCNMKFLEREELMRLVDGIFTAIENESIDLDHRALSLIFAVLALEKRFQAVNSTGQPHHQGLHPAG